MNGAELVFVSSLECGAVSVYSRGFSIHKEAFMISCLGLPHHTYGVLGIL